MARRHLLPRSAVLAVLAVLWAAPGAAVEFRPFPGSGHETLSRIESALTSYKQRKGKWPATVKQLRQFAQQNGKAFSLASFKMLRLVPQGSDTMGVEYELKANPGKKGAFAVTLITIK